MNKKYILKISNKQLLLLITSIVTIYICLTSITLISENNQIVVMRFNQYVKTIKNPGIYWLNIIGRKLIWYDKRILLTQVCLNEKLFNNAAKTKITITLIYRIQDPLVLYLTNINLDEVLSIIITGQIRNSLSNYEISKFLLDYNAHVNTILDSIKSQCESFGIEVIDLKIYN